MKSKSTRSISDFLAELSDQNRTLADWAREKGFVLERAYQVARGKAIGRRGDSRRILIAMGVTPPSAFKSLDEPVPERNSKAARATELRGNATV